ncbi:LysR family transcriptional regulator [Thalassotalea ganghwensis]
MLRISLEQWRMFRAVVEAGGFNQAAAKVHKSQSSIHNAVSKIESTLDIKLFNIEGRRTQLTETGKLLLKRANFLLDEAAKVEAVGFTIGQGTETLLRIAVDEIFPQNILYSTLDSTSATFPLLQIELMETVLTGSSELMQNSLADIAISPFLTETASSEELCDINFVAVAHPDHPLHQLNQELTLEDLKSYRQIVVRDSALGKRADAGWLGAHQRWTVSHLQTSTNMIKAGLGFAWLPESYVANEIAQGVIKPLPLSNNATRSAKLYALYKDKDNLGPAAQHFLAQLRLIISNI